MFLQQTLSPWFAIQRASQVTMILLAAAMLFIPMLHQAEEAEALPVLLIGAVAAALIGAGALIYVSQDPECSKCDATVS